ncbi:RNA-binding KH domain-containing protein PEPPER-like [Daucus carota subsp. sativus]|uniref:RNA-binding KH domain-containing protein PEPPER-like n=1 Tax=Daucus carota subsp. sativus TaxID=79200 RepID=UPI003083CAB7
MDNDSEDYMMIVNNLEKTYGPVKVRDTARIYLLLKRVLAILGRDEEAAKQSFALVWYKELKTYATLAQEILVGAEVPTYVIDPDEKVVELEGEAINVLKALKYVGGHLRNFLVDHSVLPLFEKNMMLNPTTQAGSDGSEYSDLSVKQDALFADLERNEDPVSYLSGWPYNGQAAGLPRISSLEVGPINPQVAQTTQVPLMYAHGIIGVDGSNIAYIRRYSGAIVTVQESPGLPDEITIQIKGTPSEVEVAQQLIQECVSKLDEDLLRS